jgi:two-component system OmpR family response regulator
LNTDKSLIIFVIEDNPFYQKLILKMLESVCSDVHAYTTGEKCLAELHKAPSIVIIDYMLEGKINGLETIKKIRSTNSSALIILFSTEPELRTHENLSAYGSFEFLEKSVHSLPLLKEMIDNHEASLA